MTYIPTVPIGLITDLTVSEVVRKLEEAGISLDDARIEYEGCGTHEVALTIPQDGRTTPYPEITKDDK